MIKPSREKTLACRREKSAARTASFEAARAAIRERLPDAPQSIIDGYAGDLVAVRKGTAAPEARRRVLGVLGTGHPSLAGVPPGAVTPAVAPQEPLPSAAATPGPPTAEQSIAEPRAQRAANKVVRAAALEAARSELARLHPEASAHQVETWAGQVLGVQRGVESPSTRSRVAGLLGTEHPLLAIVSPPQPRRMRPPSKAERQAAFDAARAEVERRRVRERRAGPRAPKHVTVTEPVRVEVVRTRSGRDAVIGVVVEYARRPVPRISRSEVTP